MIFDIQHRDCYDSLAAMRDAGGCDLILTSPPYPDARKPSAYGATFDTSFASYQRLGDAVFEALKPGGVCAIVIDGPVRKWRRVEPNSAQQDAPVRGKQESERSLISFKLAIDWAERVGFRYVEHCAYVRQGFVGDMGPRWCSNWEPVHVFSRPGAPAQFDGRGYTVKAKLAGKVVGGGRSRKAAGLTASASKLQTERRGVRTALDVGAPNGDTDHEAPFSSRLADAYVLCYCPPGGLVGDPFAGSDTVPYAVQRAGDSRRFIGGDLGTRNSTKAGKERVLCGRRWADIITEKLKQP